MSFLQDGTFTPLQARNYLRDNLLVKEEPFTGMLIERINSDEKFRKDFHKLIIQVKRVHENLIPNLSFLFLESPPCFFEKFVSSLRRGSFKVYYHIFFNTFEEEMRDILPIHETCRMFINQSDTERLQELLHGVDRNQVQIESTRKECLSCLKLVVREVKLDVLDILLAFLQLPLEDECLAILPFLEDDHRYPHISNSSTALLHFLYVGGKGERILTANQICLIRKCGALNVAVEHFLRKKAVTHLDEDTKLKLVKHVLEHCLYESFVPVTDFLNSFELTFCDDVFGLPRFIQILEPLSLNLDSYFEIATLACSKFNGKHFLLFLAHRAKIGQLPFCSEFVDMIMSRPVRGAGTLRKTWTSLFYMDKSSPLTLTFLLRYFIAKGADFGQDRVIHEPIGTWIFFLLCVYQKGPRLPFSVDVIRQGASEHLIKLVMSVIVSEGWSRKAWHLTSMTQSTIQLRRRMIKTVYHYLLSHGTNDSTGATDYLTFINRKSRKVEEDMFHSAVSLDDYYMSDDKSIREAIMRPQIQSIQNLGNSISNSVSTSSLSDSIRQRNILQVKKHVLEGDKASVPEICFLLMHLQWRTRRGAFLLSESHGQKRFTEEVLSRDIILYITEYLPMTKYKFFKLYVNPFLRLPVPEKAVEKLYDNLIVLRGRHDIPYSIYSSESFCNEIRTFVSADSSYQQQSANIFDKKASILYQLSTYLCPISSQNMMDQFLETIDNNVMKICADHHLLSGILRDAGNSLHTPWPLTLRQMETAMATKVFGFKQEHRQYWDPFHTWFEDFLVVLKTGKN